MKFQLGDRLRETQSGIEGVVDEITLSRFREPRYTLLRDGVDCDGNLWSEVTFYEGRLCRSS